MKLALKLDSNRGQPYCPQDVVRGVLSIRGAEFQRAPRIIVQLIGQVVLTVTAQVNGPNPGVITNQLFNVQKDNVPSKLILTRDEKGQAVYTCPVELELPSHSTSRNGCGDCQLPSSMRASGPGFTVQTEYAINVTVERGVLGKLTKSTTIRREFPFVCNILSVPEPASSPLLALCLGSGQQLRSADVVRLDDHKTQPPPFTEVASETEPFIQVQALVPQPAVFIRGQNASVGLGIYTPPQLLKAGKVFLRSVSLTLMQTTTAKTGALPRVATEPLHTCSMMGTVQITKPRLELGSEIWGNFFVHDAVPTCKSCQLQIQHTVEVEVGISRGLGKDIQFVKASLEVAVMDPPPQYPARTSSQRVS